MTRRSARLRAFALRWAPPPDYFLEHLVTRIPLVGPRMALYALAGVDFENRSTSILMLGARVIAPTRLRVGAHSVIGPGVHVDARGGIAIGRSVNVSGGTCFMTAKHGVDDPDFGDVLEPIELGDRVWIGIGATILGGVAIGEGAVVAAGAVVTKDVAPFTIVAGVPARPVRRRNPELRYELGYRPNWR